MEWKLTEKELPEEERIVLMYVPERPWDFVGKGDVHYVVGWLEKGISLKKREQLPDNSKRKHYFFSCDEYGNNLVPYCWDTFGPDRFFGQEVKAWAYIDEFEGESNE